MWADSVFLQGSGHQVCEDYANHDPAGLALVADGCSSAADSDLAARLAWLGLRRSWRKLTSGTGRAAAVGASPQVRLGPETLLAGDLEALAGLGDAGLGVDLYATTLAARVVDGRLWVTAIGDGGILVRWRWGGSRWYRLGYPAWNAPLYWHYLLDPDAAARWGERFTGNRLEIQVVDFSGRGEDGPVGENRSAASSDPAAAIQAGPGGTQWFCLDLDPAEVDWVMLCSDGIESFVDAAGLPVADLEILAGLTAFPKLTGEFLRRRVRKFFAELADRGIRHDDDFAAAVLVPRPAADQGGPHVSQHLP